MNIKLKAALEVIGMIVIITVIVAGVKSILLAATEAYGAEAVINGVTFGFISVTTYVVIGLVYDMRVAKLEYRKKLQEMVDKK